MNREEIQKYLPHRPPMLLVDEASIEVLEDGTKVAYGSYTIRGDEYFLQGHFPSHPVVPGVILCEIMGQCSSLLVMEHLVGRTPLYSGIDNARFKQSVHPGDTIKVRATISRQRGMLFFIQATAHVNEHLCTQATLSFALIDNTKLE